MGNFNQAVQTGYETGPNPFAAFIKRVNEAEARKISDHEKDKDEIRQLKMFGLELGKKYEYEKTMKEQEFGRQKELEGVKGDEDRKTETLKNIFYGRLKPEENDVKSSEAVMPSSQGDLDIKGNKIDIDSSQNGSEGILDKFGLKGYKVSKKNDIPVTEEEAISKIPKSESPDDYLIKPVLRNVHGEPMTVYIPERKKQVPVSDQNSIELLTTNLNDLARNLKVKKDKNIDTGPSLLNRPGIIADILGNIQNKKDLLSFKAEVDKAFQKYRKETTGVQAGYKELNWLAPDFPKVTDEDEVFIQKSEDSINTVKKNQEMLLNYLSDNGYAVSKFKKRITGDKSQQSDPLGLR